MASALNFYPGGCTQPILFNLYINDLVKELNNANTEPVVIGDIYLNSLLYADDIILLSNSQEGLQNSLNVLKDFCCSWKLEVNKQNSKIIVFNSNRKTHSKCFKFNNEYMYNVPRNSEILLLFRFKY